MADDRLKKATEAEKKLREQLRNVRAIRRRLKGDDGAYEEHKTRMREQSSRQSAAGREIGDIPAVVDAARRDSCRDNFRLFCETYGAESFVLAWSPDHLTAIAKIEAAVLRGELYAYAMPRGSGKTTLAEWACLWSLVYGHRRFTMLIGSDSGIAKSMLESIKAQIETNDLLLDDHPGACYPVRCLDRISQRAKGQTFQGAPTRIEWKNDRVTMPWIDGAPSAGAAIRVAGITGRIRGVKHTQPDGGSIRPSLVLVDDPQTDESAASPSQVATREKILSGAILGLAGPGSRIAGLCTITVIQTDDLADRLLDRNRHPAWQGERTKLVYEWPDRDDLWGQYSELRREGQRTGAGTVEADQFYTSLQAEMDAGARVAWPERRSDGELSAIQHAWNLRIDRGESAFAAEFQNEPTPDDITSDKLDKRSLAVRVTNVPRGVVPLDHNTLTAFVDVQERLLFWLVASWSESFGGHVVAYGCWPDQRSSFFEAAHAKRTIAAETDGAGFEGGLRTALDAVAVELMARSWKREDGVDVRVNQLMVDANWGRSTQVVRNFAKGSPFAANILPSHGRGIGASSQPLTEKNRHRGDRVGLNWRVGKIGESDHRSCLYDANFWKSFAAARLRLAVGDPESMSLHSGEHDLLFEHLTSEYPVRTEARGRVVDEWKMAGRDNHWWDCLVGATVAASVTGLQPTASETAGGRSRKKVSVPVTMGGSIKVKPIQR